MTALRYTILPVLAVLFSAIVAVLRRPGPAFTRAVRHLAAGVVIVPAAVEILPWVMQWLSAGARACSPCCRSSRRRI